ncbi:MAG: hypothetical protein D8M57_03700 [Candidatus Scalindua sp. AMX11]|nr:MAG: hypothetical protein DWQ00_10995 [Candidatus Scalindua sp.]NOG82732.1 hypothetical protein [Planctomycetota bacterium]RZV95301.1 MAG: hypothetical protein EX341_02930 [Candidatus Scalindua sp. SCAELEC01]TDE66216.1 MAG: hypothetical protein D8M57_03700 [Candidatus Scalindua sp. AMX11]GJQ57837.1 MAG: hypothetical protein SCALA701_06380 [Candidatus Scalindua sp.]
MIGFQKILCSVDFFECLLEASKYALHLTGIAHSQLTIISIIDGNGYDSGVLANKKRDSPLKLMSNREQIDLTDLKV